VVSAAFKSFGYSLGRGEDGAAASILEGEEVPWRCLIPRGEGGRMAWHGVQRQWRRSISVGAGQRKGTRSGGPSWAGRA
jgi:hypothetical protein